MKLLTIAWMTVIIGTTPAWVWQNDPDTGRQVIVRKIDLSITLNPGEGLIIPTTWTTDALNVLDAEGIRRLQANGTEVVPLPAVPRRDARLRGLRRKIAATADPTEKRRLTDLLIDEAAR